MQHSLEHCRIGLHNTLGTGRELLADMEESGFHWEIPHSQTRRICHWENSGRLECQLDRLERLLGKTALMPQQETERVILVPL
jgi:hypothetical protein